MITQQINSAIELIRHPERMDRSTIPVIKEALEHYPFYQTLHLLLLQNMYIVHDAEFSNQLKKSALCVADRSALFDMVEGLNYSIPVMKLEDGCEDGADGDKTLTLIDNFLRGVPEQTGSQGQTNDASDPMGDYSLFLEQLPDIGLTDGQHVEAPESEHVSGLQHSEATARPSVPHIPTATQPDDDAPSYEEDEEFTVSFITSHLAGATSDEAAQNSDEPVSDEQKKDYFTETMAGLYIKQHKYEQALEIIESLSAENPKKSVYFADQMRYLKLLIRINKNKNNRDV